MDLKTKNKKNTSAVKAECILYEIRFLIYREEKKDSMEKRSATKAGKTYIYIYAARDKQSSRSTHAHFHNQNHRGKFFNILQLNSSEIRLNGCDSARDKVRGGKRDEAEKTKKHNENLY